MTLHRTILALGFIALLGPAATLAQQCGVGDFCDRDGDLFIKDHKRCGLCVGDIDCDDGTFDLTNMCGVGGGDVPQRRPLSVEFDCSGSGGDICGDGNAYEDGADGTHVAEDSRLRFSFAYKSAGRYVTFNVCDGGECPENFGFTLLEPYSHQQPTFYTGHEAFPVLGAGGKPESFFETGAHFDPRPMLCGNVAYAEARWFVDTGVKSEKNRIGHSTVSGFACDESRPVRVTCTDQDDVSCTQWEVTMVYDVEGTALETSPKGCYFIAKGPTSNFIDAVASTVTMTATAMDASGDAVDGTCP